MEKQMTPREALERIRHDVRMFGRFDYSGEAYKTLKALVLATEQAPTLEKLGWTKEKLGKFQGKPKWVERYRKDVEVIDIYENGISAWNEYGEVDHILPLPELLACAEVIKEMEKEKQ